VRTRYADLFEALSDPDPERADRAFDAILFDRAEALPELTECYKSAKRNARLRYLVIQLMGFADSTDAIPTIVDATNDPHPIVRAEACRALEDLIASDHLAVLEERLNDLDGRVRLAAKEAIENIKEAH